LDTFLCPNCQSFNGFDQQGNYLIPPQNQPQYQQDQLKQHPPFNQNSTRRRDKKSSTPPPFTQINSTPNTESIWSSPSLCPSCTAAQTEKIRLLRSFDSSSSSSSSSSPSPSFYSLLESRYSLCDDCSELVYNEIQRKDQLIKQQLIPWKIENQRNFKKKQKQNEMKKKWNFRMGIILNLIIWLICIGSMIQTANIGCAITMGRSSSGGENHRWMKKNEEEEQQEMIAAERNQKLVDEDSSEWNNTINLSPLLDSSFSWFLSTSCSHLTSFSSYLHFLWLSLLSLNFPVSTFLDLTHSPFFSFFFSSLFTVFSLLFHSFRHTFLLFFNHFFFPHLIHWITIMVWIQFFLFLFLIRLNSLEKKNYFSIHNNNNSNNNNNKNYTCSGNFCQFIMKYTWRLILLFLVLIDSWIEKEGQQIVEWIRIQTRINGLNSSSSSSSAAAASSTSSSSSSSSSSYYYYYYSFLSSSLFSLLSSVSPLVLFTFFRFFLRSLIFILETFHLLHYFFLLFFSPSPRFSPLPSVFSSSSASSSSSSSSSFTVAPASVSSSVGSSTAARILKPSKKTEELLPKDDLIREKRSEIGEKERVKSERRGGREREREETEEEIKQFEPNRHLYASSPMTNFSSAAARLQSLSPQLISSPPSSSSVSSSYSSSPSSSFSSALPSFSASSSSFPSSSFFSSFSSSSSSPHFPTFSSSSSSSFSSSSSSSSSSSRSFPSLSSLSSVISSSSSSSHSKKNEKSEKETPRGNKIGRRQEIEKKYDEEEEEEEEVEEEEEERMRESDDDDDEDDDDVIREERKKPPSSVRLSPTFSSRVDSLSLLDSHDSLTSSDPFSFDNLKSVMLRCAHPHFQFDSLMPMKINSSSVLYQKQKQKYQREGMEMESTSSGWNWFSSSDRPPPPPPPPPPPTHQPYPEASHQQMNADARQVQPSASHPRQHSFSSASSSIQLSPGQLRVGSRFRFPPQRAQQPSQME